MRITANDSALEASLRRLIAERIPQYERAAVCRAAGITYQTLRRWLASETSMRTDNLDALLTACGVRLSFSTIPRGRA